MLAHADFQVQPAGCVRGYPRISQLRGLDARWERTEGYFCPYSCIISIFFEGDNVPHRDDMIGCIAIPRQYRVYPRDLLQWLHAIRRDSLRPWHSREISREKNEKFIFNFLFSICQFRSNMREGKKEKEIKFIRSRYLRDFLSKKYRISNLYTCTHKIDFIEKYNVYLSSSRLKISKILQNFFRQCHKS